MNSVLRIFREIEREAKAEDGTRAFTLVIRFNNGWSKSYSYLKADSNGFLVLQDDDKSITYVPFEAIAAVTPIWC